MSNTSTRIFKCLTKVDSKRTIKTQKQNRQQFNANGFVYIS